MFSCLGAMVDHANIRRYIVIYTAKSVTLPFGLPKSDRVKEEVSNWVVLLTDFKKGGHSIIPLYVLLFSCMFTDYSVNCEPILQIFFVFERVCFLGTPIGTISISEDGIPVKSRKTLNFLRHVLYLSYIFWSYSGICVW